MSISEIAFLGSASSPVEYGISFYSGKGGTIIVNNTFHNMSAGFYCDSVGHITIKNNNFSDNSNFGIAINQSQDDKLYNNLVKSSRISFYIAGGCANNHMYKNIIANDTFGFYFADNGSKNNLFEDNYLNGISNPISINGINNIGRNNIVYGH